MSTHYLFPEPGSIPGIPGLFTGVRVDVADDGSYTTTPLAQHYAFEASADAPVVDVSATAPEEQPTTEATTTEHREESEVL